MNLGSKRLIAQGNLLESIEKTNIVMSVVGIGKEPSFLRSLPIQF